MTKKNNSDNPSNGQQNLNPQIEPTQVLRKKPWTEEQDELVKKLVQKYGPQRWSFIARFVVGRLGKQCRERWHNHLNPKILKADWMFHQQWVLFLAHTAHGNKWAQMTKMIPGRTDNSIKNHWNSTMRKKITQFMKLLQRFRDIHQVPEHYIQKQVQLLDQIKKNRSQILNNQIPVINIIPCSNEVFSNKKPNIKIDQGCQRIKNTHYHSKSSQKQRLIQYRNMYFSSIKKSQRQFSIKQNLGSLIFETPQKGSISRNNLYFGSSNFFNSNLQVSPEPFKLGGINIGPFTDNTDAFFSGLN